jgi:hypothetical protein
MKRMMTAVFVIAFLGAGACNQQPAADANVEAPAAEAGSIDGTWVADLTTVKFDQAPDEFSLKGGVYSCATCIPPITNFAADGAFHPIADRATYDSMSVSQVDDKTVKFVRRKGDKEAGNNSLTVSADGKTMTNKYTTLNNANGKPTSGETILTRVGEPAAGAHAMSGKWTVDKIGNISPEALTVTYKVDGDVLTSTAATGESYLAKLDGSETPVKGAADGAVVSVVRVGGGYKLTSKRGGKVVDETTLTPSAEGTLAIVSVDPRDNSKVSWTARRQ